MYFLQESDRKSISCKVCIFCQDLARIVFNFNQGLQNIDWNMKPNLDRCPKKL